jgi:vancomycin resistance protein YoaR
MSRNLRIGLIAAATPLVLLLWVGVVFAMDRASDGGEVLGNVVVADVPLGGLTEAEARLALEGVEQRLASEPITVEVEGSQFVITPEQVGYSIDTEALVEQAMAVGRDGGFFSNMSWWIGHLTGGSESAVSAVATYDRATLEAIVASWERLAIDDPASEGGVDVIDGVITPMYPEPGTGIDVPGTADLVEAHILGTTRGTVQALTEFRVPVLTHDDVDAIVDDATALISGPVSLAKIQPEVELTIPERVLADALTSRVGGTADDPEIELFFSIGPLLAYLEPIRDRIEPDPIDAQIVITPADEPLLLPGSNGATIDDGLLPDAVLQAATAVTRTAPLPLLDGDPPGFTTADAEALGIRDLLYTATTFFPCCGDQKNLNRITNIQRIADETNGAIVMPGGTFSLNDHVGERTEEDGYKRAGAIIGPVVTCCDHPANVGGGVSQFTTTLYNAVFWSGLEDVDHTPHTLHFSRYPMVREATLGFPDPDLVFRNNTEFGIYVKTEYTDDSVTVKFFGDNGGIEVDGITSEPFDFTEPTEWFESDLSIPPGQKELDDDGEPGFTATVTRTITYPDGTKESQTWSWRYHPHPMIFLVHPCMLPDDHPDYDPQYSDGCVSTVPQLIGFSQNEAVSRLKAAGLTAQFGNECNPNNPDREGVIAWMGIGNSPVEPGTKVDPGTLIRIKVGKADANNDC